jgi:hypothetical protein
MDTTYKYTVDGEDFESTDQEMLTDVFGDFTFEPDCVTAECVTATHRHTGKTEQWPFINGESFTGWCSRCFPDNATID